jgi:hypothetical protein
VIGASGLGDDDDGKNDGLKWKLAESVTYFHANRLLFGLYKQETEIL